MTLLGPHRPVLRPQPARRADGRRAALGHAGRARACRSSRSPSSPSDGAGGVERYEGRLVRIDGVTVDTAVWTAAGSGATYTLTDATGTLAVRINPGVDFAGQPAPTAPFDIVGVVSQFRDAAPYIGGYQLQPRAATDILDASTAPVIAPRAPFETAATPTSVTLHWTTDRPAHSEVRFTRPDGTTGRVVRPDAHDGPHGHGRRAHRGDHLPPHAALGGRRRHGRRRRLPRQHAQRAGHDRGRRGDLQPRRRRERRDRARRPQRAPSRHAPAAPRRGDRDHRPGALQPLGQHGTQIGDALLAAKSRGVRVRLILDDATTQTEGDRLRAAGIPVITDGFGQNDGSFGLHHNKFVVIDRASTDPTRALVMTGSWNPTDSGTTDNFQNVVWIQDGALAGGYTAEFEQMWGSSHGHAGRRRSRASTAARRSSPRRPSGSATCTRARVQPAGRGPVRDRRGGHRRGPRHGRLRDRPQPQPRHAHGLRRRRPRALRRRRAGARRHRRRRHDGLGLRPARRLRRRLRVPVEHARPAAPQGRPGRRAAPRRATRRSSRARSTGRARPTRTTTRTRS